MLEEKKGGLRRLTQVNELFNQTIEDLALVDIRTANGSFTWHNNRAGDRSIACRLDRFLISEDIMMAGGELAAVVLPSSGSDHWSVILDWSIQVENLRRPFRFEKFWLLQPGFSDRMRDWWKEIDPGNGSCMYRFQQKLKSLKGRIKQWNKDSFGDIFQEKKRLDLCLQEVQLELHRQGPTAELKNQEWVLLQELNLKVK